MRVAILTPTYNRGYTLNRLYGSLCQQTSKDFKWIVVDDGSQDNTKSIIEKFINENKINIEYYYQENGGKHRALNNGIKHINEDLTLIVDSDDWLTNDAVEIALKYGTKYKENQRIACISFHRKFPDNSLSGPNYKEEEFIDNLIDYRINKNIKGEGAEIFYTKILKQYPFKEIDGENFLSEGYSWLRIALKYDTVYVDKAIYVFDYLPDGLTNNIMKLRYKNPIGCLEVAKIYFNKRFNFKSKIKAIIRYIAYGKIAKISLKKLYKEIPCKLFFIIFYPIGYVYSFKCSNYKIEADGEKNEKNSI